VAEGDLILKLARRLDEALASSAVSVTAPGPRRPAGMPVSSLDGRTLESAESRGKHLLLHFSGGLVLHSHLGMRGSWDLHRLGERWRKPARMAWIAIAGAEHEAVNFDGSSLRIVRAVELRRDPRLARLGPDILADDFDLDGACSRFRVRDEMELGEALLDQTLVAGIGNIFKSEGCFAASVSPWRRVEELGPDQLAEVLAATRSLMLASAEGAGQPGRLYRKAGRPCPRCGTAIRSHPQGDDARITYWCPRCQPSADSAGVADGANAIGADAG
jgi:endonuclease-8